jgi:predicted naringenin-chalcone synthase
MEAVTHELALRYLLELSTDIRVALLIDGEGSLVAAAPERPSEQAVRQAEELAHEALTLAPDGETAVEVDVTIDGGTVFVVREDEPTLVCVAGPFALPGLILHDMRVVLGDLRRGSAR